MKLTLEEGDEDEGVILTSVILTLIMGNIARLTETNDMHITIGILIQMLMPCKYKQ